jgi:signal transduction histidine kinase
MSSATGVGLDRRNSSITGLAMAVHDLKGHLAVISGQAKLLRTGKLGAITPPQLEALGEIVIGCNLIENQIAGMLEAGTRESAPWKPALVSNSLQQLLLQIHASLKPEFDDIGLRFDVNLCETPMVLPFDPRLLTRVVMNLLENAHRFTPPGGSVNILLEPHFWDRRSKNLCPSFERRRRERNLPNSAKIVVADSGCGIAPEYHQEIFEEYFSMPAPGSHSSSGLGLAIAQNIVHAHGGKIWVESAVGRGSRFCFVLPYAASSATDRKDHKVEKLEARVAETD